MLSIKKAQAIKILKIEDNITKLLVNCEDKLCKTINFNNLTGDINVGDSLTINTTAVELNLGTGGYHFVISNLNNIEQAISGEGHIMKLRYTPYQLKVLAAEEEDSKYHHVFNEFKSLNNTPVIVGTLHSMLLPIVEAIMTLDKNMKIVYIMTDGAALPIELSNTVRRLKNKSSIVGTITIGNAFGGDLECINIYNGLIAAREVLKADIIVATLGPGIVGTGTRYGFSGIEQGHIIDAVNTLEGYPIAVPRISFSDKRKRHEGISHHSLTVLSKICKTKAFMGIPFFDKNKNMIIKKQIEDELIHQNHNIKYIDFDDTKIISKILENSPEKMSTMGRSFLEDKEFFITAGVAALEAMLHLTDRL